MSYLTYKVLLNTLMTPLVCAMSTQYDQQQGSIWQQITKINVTKIESCNYVHGMWQYKVSNFKVVRKKKIKQTKNLQVLKCIDI